MRLLLLPALLSLLTAVMLSAQTLTGTVIDPGGSPVANARITLFNADTSWFWETRTDATGQYLFENLPGGGPYLFFGAAKPGFAYFQNATTGIIGTIVHNAQIEPETEQGQWDVIMQSPEALGGTDLGVLMPNGSIYYCHSTKDPFYFVPTENDTAFAKGSNQVQGCVGPALLGDGRVLFAGGTLQEVYGPGCKKVKTFDPVTGLWPYQPDLLDYRWYPTLAPLYDERLLIVGGGGLNNPVRVNTSEVYNPATGTTQWADTIKVGNEVSAVVPLFTGKILMTFRPPQLFDPATLQWNLAADFVQGNRLPNGDHCDHEIVLRPNGQVVAIGYKSFTPGQPGVNVEVYDPLQNAWTLGSNFAPTRSRAKVVQLPDEKILVMGGYKEDSADPTPVNNWGYMSLTDQYDPGTDSWRRLANMNWKREYHTITTLVPDGRVIAVGGEGQPGNEPPQSIIEAFSPPYLFRGIRPELSNFNKTVFQRGETIEFEAHKTNALTKVMLMSHAVNTHFMNSGNGRCLELDFIQTGNQVTVTLPSDSLHLMPGWYMLFGMVDDIPSIAHIVHILPGLPVVSAPTAGFTATPTTGCVPLTVQFTSTASPNATTFSWQFPGGDPDTSTAQNPLVVYNASGTYSVSFTASNAGGTASASQSNLVTINASPTANFTYSASNATVSFTNNSINASAFSWNFGDGTAGTEPNPTHTYAAEGTYTVELTVTNDCGTNTLQQTVTVTLVASQEPGLFQQFRLYPNPNKGLFSIDIQGTPQDDQLTFELFNTYGQLLDTQKFGFNSGRLYHLFDYRHLPAAVYNLRIRDGERAANVRVVLTSN